MARKQKSAAVVEERHLVTEKRAVRLYQLVTLLGQKPQTRDTLTRRLALNVREFYRDLELLRKFGIAVAVEESRYSLQLPAKEAVLKLPLSDPGLTIGEAEQLAKGRTKAHRALTDKLKKIQAEGSKGRSRSRSK